MHFLVIFPYRILLILCCLSPLYASSLQQANENKPFVIFIPSYNNKLYAEKNILSALNQNYQNFRIIFINACSTDKTLEIVSNIVKQHAKSQIVTLVNNSKRLLAVENYYKTIHQLVEDNEIIVCLDGDDYLIDDNVLSYLNTIYSDPNVWLTYGQYIRLSTSQGGHCRDIPEEIVRNNAYRDYPWIQSHLKTFYAGLFKKIKIEDLQINGGFYKSTYDIAFMLPMMEMAGGRFKFTNKILYVYNDLNKLNDHKMDPSLQLNIEKHIRALPRYQNISSLEAVASR